MSHLHFLSLAVVPVQTFDANRNPMSNATAFFYQSSDSRLFLITNWHVITDRDPKNPNFHKKGSFPYFLQTKIHKRQETREGRRVIQLRDTGEEDFIINCENGDNPGWIEHPDYRREVDVVAIEVPSSDQFKEIYEFNSINSWNSMQPDYVPEAMDDIFVIGYPWGISPSKGVLPLYKKGCIASDPVLSVDGYPKLLIDCRTTSGMSGGPVIVAHSGVWNPSGTFANDSVIGKVHKFLGIYSGRYRDQSGKEKKDESCSDQSGDEKKDEEISEIGIVWKEELLESLTTNGVTGTTRQEMLHNPIPSERVEV